MKLNQLTATQKNELAKKAKTSRGVLNHIISGFRQPSALMAGRIERGMIELGIEPVRRESLCEACRKCDLAKIARSKVKA